MAEETPPPPSSEESTGYVELPFPNFYSNAASVRSNFFDFSIIFSELIDNAHSTVKARVVMTPVNAKLLVSAVELQLKKYEARWGKVTIPPEFTVKSSNEPEPQP